jgi:predicted transcriptional regulator of viral defense system
MVMQTEEAYKPFSERKRMTRLGEEVARMLRRANRPLIEDHDLWEIMVSIYKGRTVGYLRGDSPTLPTLARIKELLKSERIISRDHDYARVWRLTEVPNVQADEAVCILDEGTCISHLSAMQKFNLTDRRPRTLFLTVATKDEWREIIKGRVKLGEGEHQRTRRHHPPVVRSRELDILHTKSFPHTTQMKSSFVRTTEIGETFLNMLENPERCGGMSHVLDVYSKHASDYLGPIVRSIDKTDIKLTKVRAGYILTEMLGIRNDAAEGWVRFAQRGGSQRLDPKAPYAPKFSERWMISINV